ncbi:thymidine kinase [Nanoarchaeota archaeon]
MNWKGPGYLEVITGPMFSGKTTELINKIQKYEAAGKRTSLFKYKKDKRYDENKLSTHDQKQVPAYPILLSEELIRGRGQRYDTEVIGIDEAQFLDSKIIDFCEEQVSDGVIVIVTCLNLDYLGQPFKFFDEEKDVGSLIAAADIVTKLSAICTYEKCCAEATRTMRLVKNDSLVLLGGSESYTARCREHWRLPI